MRSAPFVLVSSLLFAVMASCGKGEGVKGPLDTVPREDGEVRWAPAVLLTAADLEPGPGLRSMPPADLEAYMALHAERLVASRPGSTTLRQRAGAAPTGASHGVSAAGACVDEAFARLPLAAAGSLLEVRGEVDSSACLRRQMQEMGLVVRVVSQTLRVYFSMSCDGADLSSLDGRAVADLLGPLGAPCRGSPVVHASGQLERRVRIVLPMATEGGEELLTFAWRSLGSEQGPDARGCVYRLTPGGHVGEACDEVTREVVTEARLRAVRSAERILPDEGSETYVKAVRRAPRLVALTVDDWQGQAAWDPETQSQASWRVSNGTVSLSSSMNR